MYDNIVVIDYDKIIIYLLT